MKILSTKSVIIFTSVIILVNIIVSTFNDLYLLRCLRVITTLIFLLLFFNLRLNKSLKFTLIFVSLVFSDIGILYYEIKWFCYLKFLSFIAIYLILIKHIFKIEYLKNVKPIVLVTMLVLTLSCLFLVSNLVGVLDFSVFGELHKYLFYAYTITITVLLLLTIIYNLNSTSKKVDIFFGSVICFFISDLLLTVGYYQDFYLVMQIERFFHITAMFTLLYYVFLLKDKEESITVEDLW